MTPDDVTAALAAAERLLRERPITEADEYDAVRVARALVALAPVLAECRRFAASLSATGTGDGYAVRLVAYRTPGEHVTLTLGDVRRAAGGGAGPCAFEGCDRPATDTAVGRLDGHTELAKYCDVHAGMVSDEGAPEYVESCPACGCRFGVN